MFPCRQMRMTLFVSSSTVVQSPTKSFAEPDIAAVASDIKNHFFMHSSLALNYIT